MTGDVLALLLVNGCLLAAGAGVTRALGAWRRAATSSLTVLATSFLAGVAVFGVARPAALRARLLPLGRADARAVCATARLGRPPARRATRAHSACSGWLTRLEWVAALPRRVPADPPRGRRGVPAPLLVGRVDPVDPEGAGARRARRPGQLPSSRSPPYGHWHPDYPLLVPALEAFAFRFGVGVRVVHLEFWLLLAAFAVVAGRAAPPARRAAARPGRSALAIVWTPKLGAEALSANADMPLAIFLVLAAVAAWLWISEGSTAGARARGGVRRSRGGDEAGGRDRSGDRPRRRRVVGAAPVAPERPAARRCRGRDVDRLHPVAALDDADRRADRRTRPAPSSKAVQDLEPSRVPIASLLLLQAAVRPRGLARCSCRSALCALAVAVLALRRDRVRLAVAASAALLLVVAHRDRARDPTPLVRVAGASTGCSFLPAVLAGAVLVRRDAPDGRRAAGFVTTSIGGDVRRARRHLSRSRRTTSPGSSGRPRAVWSRPLGTARRPRSPRSCSPARSKHDPAWPRAVTYGAVRVSFLVPVYNEAATVVAVLDRVGEHST